MSGAAAIGAGAPSGQEPAFAAWHVRPASPQDVGKVAVAVAELLVELGGTPPAAKALEATTHALMKDRGAGAVLVAETDAGALVGVLAASWQLAIHTGGHYALIQDLWVARDWRNRAVGHALLEDFCHLARELGMARIEVGLPQERFAGLAATGAFYRHNGFEPLGTRMRRALT